MAVMLYKPFKEEHPNRKDLAVDPMEEKYWSRKYVSDILKIPLESLGRLAKKGVIVTSTTGGISDISFCHLSALLPHLLKNYELASVAKKQLGQKTYDLVVAAGKLVIVTGLGMEIVKREQLKSAMDWKILIPKSKVAKLFSVHPGSVSRWLYSSRLDGVKIKGKWYVFGRSVNDLALRLNSGAAHQKTRIRVRAQRIIDKKKDEVQRLRYNTQKRIARILDQDELQKKDLQFAMYHLKGCTGNQLQEHLKGDYNGSISGALRRGRLDGTREGHVWHISFVRMIWTISLVRNWTPLGTVRQSQVSYDTMVKYTKEGKLGEVRPNLSGLPSIRTSMVSQVDEICRRVKKEKLDKKSEIMKVMRQGQLCDYKTT